MGERERAGRLVLEGGINREENGWAGLGRVRAATHKWMCGALATGATLSKCGADVGGATHPATSVSSTPQRRGRHVGWVSGAGRSGATQ